jgi:hypothetical protein
LRATAPPTLLMESTKTTMGSLFPTSREITVSEKNKLDIQLKFKQYEFNKDLSISFNIPANFKRL